MKLMARFWAQTWVRVGLLLLWGLAFALLLPQIISLIEALGYQIPQHDMERDYIFGILTAITLGLAILTLRLPDKKILLMLWGARCFVTLVLMLLYEWHYGLDAFYYFEQSQIKELNMHGVGFFESSGTYNLIAFFWFIEKYLFPVSSYHALKVLCSFAGLWAVYIFYRAIVFYFEKEMPRLLLFFGLFPSLLFWSSILGKDPLNLLGVALFVYGMIAYLKTNKSSYVLSILAGLMLILLIRPWGVTIFLTSVVVFFTFRFKNFVAKMIFLTALVSLYVYSMKFVGDRFSIDSAESFVDTTHSLSRSWNRGGSATEVPAFRDMGAIIGFLPKGVFAALFRPFPLEIWNVFGFLAGLENMFMLLLLAMFFHRKGSSKWRDFSDPLLFWFTSVVIIWSMIYGFISYQNLGAAFRFKLQVLPLLLFTLLYISGSRLQKYILENR